MLDTKRPGQEVRDKMAKENVMIGRVWPSMPTWVRVTVGTAQEMARFQSAFEKVIKA
jgi:histidinol-phosphate aminotransferase